MADYASPGSPVAGRVVAASDPVSKFEQENEDLLGQDDALSLSYHIHISPVTTMFIWQLPRLPVRSSRGVSSAWN